MKTPDLDSSRPNTSKTIVKTFKKSDITVKRSSIDDSNILEENRRTPRVSQTQGAARSQAQTDRTISAR